MQRWLAVLCLLGGLAAEVNALNYTNPLVVPGAWPDYGIGDPFVLRHDGIYYLYASTKDGQSGIRVWSSSDLISWTPRGECASDPSTTGAYAPEVTYWNGWFWLATSPAGAGHRFYRSRSPLGPFVAFTENLGLSIDGSFYRDEDGRLYFYHASPRGILGHEVSESGEVGPEVLLSGTWMGHWTEGPFLFRRGKALFLGMTGNHVMSAGYRENYAVGTTPLGAFVQPENNPLLLHTSPPLLGLGHASPILGPDLVSYWLVYHNLEGVSAEGPPRRSLDLDRLVFNDRRLEVLGPTDFPNEAPAPAEGTLPATVAGPFTAEITLRSLVKGGGVTWSKRPGFSLTLVIDPSKREVCLEEERNSQQTTLARGGLFPGFDATVAHTLRVEAGAASTSLWIDGWRPFPAAVSVGSSAGRLQVSPGPQGDLPECGWTGWTSGSVEDADRGVVHPLPGRLQAVHGAASAGVAGWSLGQALQGPQELSYRVAVAESGLYGFRALLRGTSAKVEVAWDGATLPIAFLAAGEAWALVDGGSVPLTAGEHRLTIRLPDSAVIWDTLFVERRADGPPAKGSEVDGGLWGRWGNPDTFDARYRITVERKVAGPDVFSLVVRGSQWSRHPDQVSEGYVGYRVGLSGGTVTLTRVSYERQTVLGSFAWKFPVGVPVRIEVSVVGSSIRVGPQGESPWLSVVDPLPLPPGQGGWFSSSGRVRFSLPEVDPRL